MPERPTVEVDFIAPRHLAGAGDPAWITVPLHRACGWSHGDDPLMPRVVLSSPGQKAVLRLEPDPDGQWWTLHHAQEPARRDHQRPAQLDRAPRRSFGPARIPRRPSASADSWFPSPPVHGAPRIKAMPSR